jgi:tetratricopeptide (TPR) repeat protein
MADAATAAEAYAAALALVPALGDQVRIPGSQRFVNGTSDAWELLERAVALDPALAPVHAARANVLLRGGFVDHARDAYARAVALDPDDAASRYALAELAYLARDEPTADAWFADAFARRRLFSPPRPVAGTKHALVLGLAGPWPRNMPLDFVVDDRRWTLHRWFLPDPQRASRAVPRVDLIVNALGESVAGADALADVRAIVAAHDVPVINAPDRLRALGRDRLAATLAGLPRVRTPDARRLTEAELRAGNAGLAYPLLVRPIDTHGGRGLEKLDAPAAVAAYLARVPAAAYDCSSYVDYRSADGWFRKYRIMFVDDVAYPYHLAIDENWMIHYYRTGTTATPWMNDEEARFLEAPDRAIAGWHDAVPAIAAALALDYVGIDCAQLPDGTLLVFEADAAMLVHALDASDAGRYKRAAVARIKDALAALFERRAERKGA